MSKVIYIDIDQTICDTPGDNYEGATPIRENIHKANKMYDEGNIIIYWTARGAMNSHKKEELYLLTLDQLKRWGVRFTSLRLDKPFYDLLIDDKALSNFDVC